MTLSQHGVTSAAAISGTGLSRDEAWGSSVF